jgi:hypothetical protein
MNKKLLVLMLVSMFLLVTMQSISAVETKTGVTVSTDEETTGGAIISGFVYYGETHNEGKKGEPVAGAGVTATLMWHLPFWSGSATTNNYGRFEIKDVPYGLKDWIGNDKWFRVRAGHEGDGSELGYWEGFYNGLRCPEPREYHIPIYVYWHHIYSSELPDAEENIQKQQQVQSVFSGSQSL